MTSYHVIINEAQRERIAKALAMLDAVEPVVMGDESEYLTEMVVELPQGEAENPGIWHGFSASDGQDKHP